MNLTALQNSAFLKSLGWAIANSLWQAAVLLILYYLVITSYKSASSKFKNNISTTFLFSIFTWFSITFIFKFISLKNITDNIHDVNNSAFIQYISIPQNNGGFKYFINSTFYTLPYLSLAYLFLLLVLSIRLINSYRNIFFIKNFGLIKPYAEWRLFTEKVANQISIDKKVKIWFSKYVDVPATIGFLKPVILIPLASINQLTTQQLEAIILHELSHIKRNDYLINLFISIIETVLFFNPFVVLLSKIIKKERENCCDDFVLQYQYDRYSYASALLSLEEFRNQKWNLALAATSGKKQLLTRIKRIMEVKSKNVNFNYGQRLFALVLITGIIASIAWLSPEKKLNQNYNQKVSANPASIKSETKVRNIINDKLKDQLVKSSASTLSKKSIHENYLKNKIDINNNKLREIKDEATDNIPFTYSENDDNEKKFFNDVDEQFAVKPSINYFQHLPEVITTPVNKNILQSYLPDLKILNDLHFNADVLELKKDLEKANLEIALLDWNKINDEIKFNLKKADQAPEVARIIHELRLEKLIQNIQNDNKNVAEQNRRAEQNLKAIAKAQASIDKDRIIERKKILDRTNTMALNMDDGIEPFKSPASPSVPKQNLELYSHVQVNQKNNNKNASSLFSDLGFNFRTDDNAKATTVEIENKKSSGDKMSVEFKNGSVYINGEKINSANSKKIQAMFKAKKFVIAFDNDEAENQSDD